MTHIAPSYRISRTFLSQLLLVARLHLAGLFREETCLLHNDQHQGQHLIFLWRLEGKGSLARMAAICKTLPYHPHAVGSLSHCLHNVGRALPSPVLMASKQVVLSLSDAIFAIDTPIVVTIDAHSTTILTIELASDRSAKTWKAHCTPLKDHRFDGIGMASDRGTGVVAGSQAAGQEALWVGEYFPAFRDLFNGLHPLETQASRAITKEHEAAQQGQHATSEATFDTRLHQYAHASQACEPAMAQDDQRDLLLQLLRETLLLGSPQGTRRTRQGVHSALSLLVTMIKASNCAALSATLKPIQAHLDDIVVPGAHAEVMQAPLRAVVPQQA